MCYKLEVLKFNFEKKSIPKHNRDYDVNGAFIKVTCICYCKIDVCNYHLNCTLDVFCT